MKRKLLTLILLILSISLFAAPSIYMRTGYAYSFDTNIFSYPLVKRGDSAYLDYRIENPFIYRMDNNFKLATDIYFKAEGRVGLSFAWEVGVPFKAITYTPSSNDHNSDWSYIKADAINEQSNRMFFGLGPSFRAILGNFDLGFNTRLIVGTYNNFSNDLILGLNTEAFMNYFFGETFFFFTNIDLSAQFMSFYLDELSTKIFREHYIMGSASASVGVGIKFGPRG